MERAVLFALALIVLLPGVAGAQAFVYELPDVRLSPDVAEVRVEPGKEATFTFTVWNADNDTFHLFATFSPAAHESRLASLVEPKSFVISPGHSVNVTVRVIALNPENTTIEFGVFRVLTEGGFPLLVAPVGLVLEGIAPPAPDATETPLLAFARENAVALGLGASAATAFIVGRGLWRRENVKWALLAAYTRLARSDVLRQERREVVFDLIVARPGIHFTQIKNETQLPSGVLVHHLRTLERHGYVVSRKDGPYRRFAPVDSAMPDLVKPVLTPAQENVLAIIAEQPMSQRRLAERLDISPQAANQHVKALEKKGFLVIAYEKGEWICRVATPLVRR